ncbi:alpha/beta fold hydrolase [Micromonospora sp. DT201]|uniref:alpha/beta fold hydrolase n=1 Tax=Micromonospora sp. DT201 TaxID=3393442 RepID=UPI003CEAD5EC
MVYAQRLRQRHDPTVGWHATHGDGGRVVLLHGLANSSGIWSRLGQRWQPEGRTLWAADLPWAGDGPVDWCHRPDPVPALADVLAAVPGRGHLVVAHSFSANLLLRLLAEGHRHGADPVERYGIDAVVLVAPLYRRAPENFNGLTVAQLYDSYVQVMEEGIRLQRHRAPDPELVHDMAARVCERIGPYGWFRVLDACLSTPWLRLGDVSLPTLVIAGTTDPVGGEAEALADALPRGRLAVGPRSGHFPMVDDVEWFAATLREFAESVAAPSSPLAGAS